MSYDVLRLQRPGVVLRHSLCTSQLKNHQSSIAIRKSDAWGSAFPRARGRAPARNRNRSGLHPTPVPILCGGSICATALVRSEARIHAVPAAERAVGWFRQFDYDDEHEHDYEQELVPVKIAWSVHSITNYEHEHEQEQEDIEKWKMSNGKCKMTRRDGDASSVCARHAAKFRNSDSELAECKLDCRVSFSQRALTFVRQFGVLKSLDLSSYSGQRRTKSSDL